MPKRLPAPLATFEGFADRRARFFHELAKHQTREWFAAHRHEYEQGWFAPMKLLLAELRERLDPVYPRHHLGEPKVFRIFRDVRFSKDKSPYKTHIGGYLPMGGGGGPSNPTPLYVHLGTDVFVAAGHYMMEPAQLAAYRDAVLNDRRGAALSAMLRKLARAGFSVGSHDSLKNVPRGLDPSHPRADLLRRKGLIVSFPTLPRELLVGRELVSWLVARAKRAAPVVDWLALVTE